MELMIYLECIKKDPPPFRGVFKWRWEAELNRCKRICSPRPNRSAIPPVKWCVVYQKLFAPVNREKLWGSRLWHSQRRGGQGADRAIQKPQRHPVILKTAVGRFFLTQRRDAPATKSSGCLSEANPKDRKGSREAEIFTSRKVREVREVF